METLVQNLKQHLDLKLEQQKYSSIDGVLNTIKEVFGDLEQAFESYSIGGDKLVWSIEYPDKSDVVLYVKTLKEEHTIREFHCLRTSFATHPLLSLECVLPDSSLGGKRTKVGNIEILNDHSVLREFGNGHELTQSFGLGGNESNFTRSVFEKFLEKVILHEI